MDTSGYALSPISPLIGDGSVSNSRFATRHAAPFFVSPVGLASRCCHTFTNLTLSRAAREGLMPFDVLWWFRHHWLALGSGIHLFFSATSGSLAEINLCNWTWMQLIPLTGCVPPSRPQRVLGSNANHRG